MDKVTNLLPPNGVLLKGSGEDEKVSNQQLDSIFTAMDELANAQPIDPLTQFDKYRITKEKDIPQFEPTITIAGAAIASPGNITGIGAAAKAGKTAVTTVMAAGAISTNGTIDGFPDIQIAPNTTCKAVIHIDTEQSEADQQHNVKTVLRRAFIESTPDYYRAYNIRQLKMSEYQSVTDQICNACASAFNGIHLIIIDGAADYIISVNDDAASTEIVQYFTHLAIKYQCPVILVVHHNPGSNKERGHLGSEIQRKCFGLLEITKDGDISTLAPKIMRKAGNGEIPNIQFTYSKQKGYHVGLADAEPGAVCLSAKKSIQQERGRELADIIFKPGTALTHTEAYKAIMQYKGLQERQSKELIKNLKGWDFISQGEDGRYRRNLT